MRRGTRRASVACFPLPRFPLHSSRYAPPSRSAPPLPFASSSPPATPLPSAPPLPSVTPSPSAPPLPRKLVRYYGGSRGISSRCLSSRFLAIPPVSLPWFSRRWTHVLLGGTKQLSFPDSAHFFSSGHLAGESALAGVCEEQWLGWVACILFPI